MATDFLFSLAPSQSIIAGLFVAGLSAVYAYTQLGNTPGHTQPHHDTHTTHANDIDRDLRASQGQRAAATSGALRKGRKKRKNKGTGTGVGEDGSEDRGNGGAGVEGRKSEGEAGSVVAVPGGFEGTETGLDVAVDASVVSRETSGTASQPAKSGKTKKTKKKQGKGKGEDKGKSEGEEKEEEEHKEEGDGTGKKVEVGDTPPHGSHSRSSTDASVSLSPSASASALVSSRAVGKGNLRASKRSAAQSQPRAQTRAHVASQPREIRPSPSLSFDTDSSWTHVDHRRLKMSDSVDGQVRTLADSMDMTSSDLASTASNSPVAERMSSLAIDVRGTPTGFTQRTLAEKLVPRPRKTGVDDMLERPDVPTLARVMRVQPPANESPVPGFSWEDYGDVAMQDGDSLLIHDADEEDEGEWGVVKSRRRNHTQPTQTAAVAMTTSTSSVASAASPTMTKKQRQNARKRELAKSAKAEAETARLEGLAKHKRELERLRSIEQSQT